MPHGAWRQARAEVFAALAGGPCLIALVGSQGTGKSVLMSHVARTLGLAAAVHAPHGGPVRAAPGEILIADDADRLSVQELEELARADQCFRILAVSPERAGRLEGLGAPVITVILEPIRAADVPGFLAAQAGTGPGTAPMSAAAAARLATLSGGDLRRLEELAGLALLAAGAEGARTVEAAHIDRVAGVSAAPVAEQDTLELAPYLGEAWPRPGSRRPDLSKLIALTLLAITAVNLLILILGA